MSTEVLLERRQAAVPPEPQEPPSAAVGSFMRAFPLGTMFTFDRDLRYLTICGLGPAGTGRAPAFLEGKAVHEVFDDAMAALMVPLYRAALRGQSATHDVPFGGRIYSQQLSPVYGDRGEIVAGMGVVQDVTALRDAEHALRMQAQRARLTFENAPIGQALVALDGRWIMVNSALTRLLGYSEDELLALTFQDITHPDDLDADLDLLNQLVAGDIESYQMEKRYLTADGAVVWALLSVSLVHDEVGHPLYFISQIEDITARVGHEETLRDLLAMLSHDLRTPLQVIIGMADLLSATSDGSVSAARHDFVRRINAAGQDIMTLLEECLAASALGERGVAAHPVAVRVDQAVDAALDQLQEVVPEAGRSAGSALTAWIDPAHLRQVLSNLLTNAHKYGGAVDVAIEDDGDSVLIHVVDDGPGVSPDFVPRLFERFSRSLEAQRSGQRGTGLGLYIVRSLLALNDATIAYRPRPGGGSVFTVRCPKAGSR